MWNRVTCVSGAKHQAAVTYLLQLRCMGVLQARHEVGEVCAQEVPHPHCQASCWARPNVSPGAAMDTVQGLVSYMNLHISYTFIRCLL